MFGARAQPTRCLPVPCPEALLLRHVSRLFGNHALDVGDTICLPPDDTWYRVKKV